MNFKKYLPIESYTLTSKLSIEEIKMRISENLEPKKTFRFSFLKSNYTKPYQGQISGDTFQISRIVSYKNSFLPIITGRMSSFLGQTLIKIKMRPIIFVIIFMSFWLGIVSLVFLILLLGALFQSKGFVQNNIMLGILVTFCMLLFGWSLTYFGFKYESKKSRQFLSAILEGQETNEY